MTVIICGVTKGFKKAYRCPLCGLESDDIEKFAISMCWDCVYENRVEEPEDWEDEDEDTDSME